MTAPVTSAPSVRAPRLPGTGGDSNGGAPFASALDGALHAGRDHDVAAGTRRGPQSEQRPDRGEHRAVGHDRADRPPVRQNPGNRAHGTGDRGARRAEDREPERTPSTSADDPSTTADPGDVVDAGVAAAISSGIPPAWILPTLAAPMTAPAAGTDPAAGPAGVAAVAGAPGPSTVILDPSVSPATPGLPGPPPGSPSEDDVPALPPADPSAATAAQPPATAGDVGTTVVGGPAVRGAVPGEAGVVMPSAAGPHRSATPSAAVPSTVPALTADGDSPAARAAVSTAPPLPGGPPPARVRSASVTGTGPDATAPPVADVAGDGGAALPDPGSVAVTSARGTGDSPSSDPGDTSRQDPGATAAAPSAGVVAPPLAPAAAVAPVAATTAAAPPAPVAAQVAAQVVVLSQGPDDTHSVTLVLHPDSLGPVQVQVTLNQGTVDLTMRGAHEHGRAALMDALPDLRRDLETAGLSCSKLDVDRDTGGSWSAQHQSAQHQSAQHQSAQQQAAHQQWADQGRRQQEWSDGRFRPWSRTADSGDSRQVPAPTRSTSRGVDVRV
jgi:flagellar hook-length control protein FliK